MENNHKSNNQTMEQEDLSHLGVLNEKTSRPEGNHLIDDDISSYVTLEKGFDDHGNMVMIHETQGFSYLKTKVTHNGKISGDAGHGGKVEIRFKSDYIDNLHQGTIEVRPTGPYEFSIILRGEAEREQFVQALEQIVDELK